MVQISPESAVLHKLLKVAMRRHNHADIDLGRLLRADPLDLALFEDAQQFGLHRHRHIANLIEKQRSPMRLFKFPARAVAPRP